MPFNEFKAKSNRELSEYQKTIEQIDNVILCVAQAEKMIQEIGSHLIPEPELFEHLRAKSSRRGRLRQAISRKIFK
ncbi:MAG: hypothetical protein FJY85_16105 [Deltaproteobacteria bacterium]|nr:hypothetical protein [Deltaproteobacteria bacterium]